MSPKQKLITIAWCCVTMTATMIVSHGHLIMKEVLLHWPTAESWEGRLESALYTQGGLVFLASCVIAVATLVRSFFTRMKDEELARRELSQREKHERAAALRHDALMQRLTGDAGTNSVKKSYASGAKPR